jgi:hypothetical protein
MVILERVDSALTIMGSFGAPLALAAIGVDK